MSKFERENNQKGWRQMDPVQPIASLPDIKEHARILVVDDSPANVLLLEKILQLNRYHRIRSITDPREFFVVFQEFHPDIILLDLQMPHLDGFTILERLRNERADKILPVIVITAQNDKENKLKALEFGAQDFLGKPFDNIEVITRIGNLLQNKMLYDTVENNNLFLERKVQERTNEVKKMQVEIVDRLMRAAESRDQGTGNHIARISSYVTILASKLGYSEEEAILIGNASKMHDLGKVGIPDSILLKPGILTNVEMERMKGHSAKGAQILSGSKYELLKIAEQIAQTHHEKWDGSGYPDGLKGEAIPLVGRIAALADVFDALITSRPYKDAWFFDDVLTYINDQRGFQFDPMVVDAFFDSVDAFDFVVKNLTVEVDE